MTAHTQQAQLQTISTHVYACHTSPRPPTDAQKKHKARHTQGCRPADNHKPPVAGHSNATPPNTPVHEKWQSPPASQTRKPCNKPPGQDEMIPWNMA
eukprot:CAMPEP_0174288096 /NCGR_PEP_ID=MMETSP0809-20121228/19108_1 /TAXON_ID=73025 ORGANISM="Eutreptiella gymnastica-like, Strain CCMP1594" /NCGR_SAMPLE_ID=MMETSP0809 /ASSEMBLY_ACC=CAM_ASM_000658 /LENGTH=96 /DNA_ID=CAMNT_0015385043 /DNA_START=57 /DNA_END=347 /DNA_ORIENTATION=+